MSSFSSLVPPSPNDSTALELVFKQFFLETERLELTYSHLQEQFKSVHHSLQESNTRLSGKLAELNFITCYLETILEQISQGILFIDLSGIVTTCNAAAQKLLKIEEKDLLFHHFSEFFDDRFFGFSLQEAFAIRQCPETIYKTWTQKGESIDLEVEATFVAKADAYSIGNALPREQAKRKPIQGLLILLRDMTKLRRLQQEAYRTDRLKELGELAAHLAHEIRNPLGGIKGFATILEHELKGRADLQQMTSHIVQGVDELNLFVSNILQYARPFSLQAEEVDLVKLIEEIRELLLADPAWSPGIQFMLHFPASSCKALIDSQLFKSALLNLSVNAMQAMPQGGKLTIRLQYSASWIYIYVEDTGVGIASENMPKLFSPFFTTKERGNGLGLAEVQKVIQAHQGVLEVHSEVGKGTIFTIKIPTHLTH